MPEVSEKAVLVAAVERLARFNYAKHVYAMDYAEDWEGESEGHRNLWRDGAREQLEQALPHLTLDEPLRELLGWVEAERREAGGRSHDAILAGRGGFTGKGEVLAFSKVCERIRTQLEGEDEDRIEITAESHPMIVEVLPLLIPREEAEEG